MNEDRMIGSVRDVVDKAEHGLGDAVGSDMPKGNGLVEHATGTIQDAYGAVESAVAGAIGAAPDAVAGAVSLGRELGRQGNEVVRQRLADNGPLYILAGAVAVFAIGAFALTRLSPPKAPKPSPQRGGAESPN